MLTIFLASLAAACAPGGTRSGLAAARPDEVLIARGYGKRLMAIDIRTCATRELPIIGLEPVAFTRDHKVVATLRRIPAGAGYAVPSRLAVGPASKDERDSVWTVGDEAVGGMAFDPSGERIALGLQHTRDRGGTFAPEGVDNGLWIVNRSGGERRQVVPGTPERFAWSPDGTQIASTTSNYSVGSRTVTVWVVDVASGRQRVLITIEQQTAWTGVMDWSPDGQNILVVTGTDDPLLPGQIRLNIEQVGIGDGRRTQLLGSAASESYRSPMYSADGTRVVAQLLHLPIESTSPPSGPSATLPVSAPDRRSAELVSIGTNGTDLRPLCPTDPDDRLLDWH